jgi:hypothetical protein
MCLCSTQNGAFVLPTFQSQAPGGCHSSLASLLTLVPKASPSTLNPHASPFSPFTTPSHRDASDELPD